jgi:ankyrin repeat protein
MTALHFAAKYWNSQGCDMLIESGSDIDARSKTWDTPLHLACLHGNYNAAIILINAGANVQAKNHKGMKPIHMIASFVSTTDPNHFRADFFEGLLDFGADLNEPSSSGSRPLHLAAKAGNEEICMWLIGHGANPKLKLRGLTAFEIAKEYGHEKLAEKLKAHQNAMEASEAIESMLRSVMKQCRAGFSLQPQVIELVS